MKNPKYAVLPVPPSVKIGPYRYRVIKKKHIVSDDGKDLYGWIRQSEQTIHIQSGVSPSRTLAILVHEVLHGVDEVVEANMSEEQISRMAPTLAAFLSENGMIPAEWLAMIEAEAEL